MIKKIAWETFKNTGDINTFLEFKQIRDFEDSQNNMQLQNNQGFEQNIENSILQKVETDGDNKNKWNNNF